jgi:CIC family chloride channel protein
VVIRLRGLLSNDQFVLGVLAVVMGLVVGCVVVAFRMLIDGAHLIFFGATEDVLHSVAAALPWWRVWMAPVIGGAVVGLLYHFFMPGGRAQSISHVIEAAALRGGRMNLKAGVVSALGAAISIGAGASVGREGPAVHLGSALCAWGAEKLHLGASLSRTLLGCGAAAAVAASFNAPIAGALFAHEVVVGHYAMSALAPVVVSSVTATLVSRAFFGHFPAFVLPDMHLTSVLEFPAFAGLGLLSGIVAIVFMQALFMGETLGRKMPVPNAIKPILGGVIVGALAVPFPYVLSVGYEITDLVLKESVPLLMVGLLIVAKVLATSVALGFGFGGGVFSPSLTVGALVGSLYGALATQAMPSLSSGSGAYALIGMGAVAAAVLGAPVSTVLIIFEMTHDTVLTVAVMMAVVLATTLSQAVLKVPSYFYWQLDRRGLDLRGGHQLRLLRTMTVSEVSRGDCPRVPVDAPADVVRNDLAMVPYGELFVADEENRLVGTIMLADLLDHADNPQATAGLIARRRPPVLQRSDTLEDALKVMMSLGEEHMAVVETADSMILVGCVSQAELLLEYNRQVLRAQDDGNGRGGLPF